MKGTKKLIINLLLIACAVLIATGIAVLMNVQTVDTTTIAKVNTEAITETIEENVALNSGIVQSFNQLMSDSGVMVATDGIMDPVTTPTYQELSTNKADYENATGVAITFDEFENVTGDLKIYYIQKDDNSAYRCLTFSDISTLSNTTIYVPAIEFIMNWSASEYVYMTIEAYYDEITVTPTKVSSIALPHWKTFGVSRTYIGKETSTSIRGSRYCSLYEPEIVETGYNQVSVFAINGTTPYGQYEDGSIVKFYAVPDNAEISAEDFISPMNPPKKVFNNYRINNGNYYIPSTGGGSYNTLTSQVVTGKHVLFANYIDAVEVTFYELIYDIETREVTKNVIESKMVYDNNLEEIPNMPEKEGYSFFGWTSNYHIDETGLNMIVYPKYRDEGQTLPSNIESLYCTYYKKGGGPLEEVYISQESNDTMGDDANKGSSPYDAVYSLERALQMLKKNGTIYVAGTLYIKPGQNLVKELNLEEYGENVKFMRAETCKNEMIDIDESTTEYFEIKNVIIDGNGKKIRSANSAIISRSNLILGEGAIIQNNYMSYIPQTSKHTEVDGGAGLRMMLGANLIMNEGAIVRNNKLIYKYGDEEFEHEWLNTTELVNVPVAEYFWTSDYNRYENTDVTFKITSSDIKDMSVVFGYDYIDEEAIIYDKMYNPCYYIYPETDIDNDPIITYGDVIYIRFPNGISEDSDWGVSDIRNYSNEYDAGYIDAREGHLGGGGIELDNQGSSMIMNGGEIYGNSAYWGGGIWVGPQNSLMINGGKIYNNEAEYGGAIYAMLHTPAILLENEDISIKNYDLPDILINNADIYGNKAKTDGGAIYVDGALCEINGGNIYSNIAENSGGGIYISASITENDAFESYYDGNIINGAEIPSLLEMNGGNIYSNTAYVGGGIYNANECLLKAGNIYENKVTKSLEETENYGGTAIYAYEDVTIWPEMKLEGDIRVCVDEGANIIAPEGLEEYKSYKEEDKDIIDISVEESIAHENYTVVKGEFSKSGYSELTEEQIKCAEAAKAALTGKEFNYITIPESPYKENQLELDNYLLGREYYESEGATFENIYRRDILKNIDGIYMTPNMASYDSAYYYTESFELTEVGSISIEGVITGSTNQTLYIRLIDENNSKTSKLCDKYTTKTDINNLEFLKIEFEDVNPGKYYLEIYYDTNDVSSYAENRVYIRNIEYTQNGVSNDIQLLEKDIDEATNAGFIESTGEYTYIENGYYALAEIKRMNSGNYLGTISFEYSNNSEAAQLLVYGEYSDKPDILKNTVVEGETTWKTYEYNQLNYDDYITLEYKSDTLGDVIKIRNIKFTPFEYVTNREYKKVTQEISMEDDGFSGYGVNYFEQNGEVYSSLSNVSTSELAGEVSVETTGTLTFDWAISSYATNKLIVTAINKETGDSIELASLTNTGTVAEDEASLVYTEASASIEPGEYYIKVTFTRTNTTSTGLNKAYIKNIKLDGNAITILSEEEVVNMEKFTYEDGVYTSNGTAYSGGSYYYNSYIYTEKPYTISFEYLITGNGNYIGGAGIRNNTDNYDSEVYFTKTDDWKKVELDGEYGNVNFDIGFNCETNSTKLQIRNIELSIADATYVDTNREIRIDEEQLSEYDINYFNQNGEVYSSLDNIGTSASYLVGEVTAQTAGTLTFDWAISSYATNKLIVRAINKETGNSINLSSLTYTGTAVEDEASLVYTAETVNLEAGNYYIVVEFSRSSTSTGLNKAYIKNIKLDGNAITILSEEEVVNMRKFTYEDGVYKSNSTAFSESSYFWSDYLNVDKPYVVSFEYLIIGNENGIDAGTGIYDYEVDDYEYEVNLVKKDDWQTVYLPVNEGSYGWDIWIYTNTNEDQLQVRNIKLMEANYTYIYSNSNDLNNTLTETDLSKTEYVGLNGWSMKLDTARNAIELTKDVVVTKEWEDQEDKNLIRPTLVIGELFKDGTSLGNIELREENDWTYTIKEAGKLNENDPDPVYTLEEDEVSHYTSELITGEDGNLTLKNTLDSHEITTKVNGEGGTITGEGETPYETVVHGENSVKEIKATPEAAYKVKKITVNGEEIEYEVQEDGTVILAQFENMTEDKEVVVEYERRLGTVVTHYLRKGGEIGNEADKLSETVTETGLVGDEYKTEEATDIPGNYELVEVVGETEGEFIVDEIVVIYYYDLKEVNIVETVINKEGPEKITTREEKVEYTITYTAKIETYIGEAEVMLVDRLPYEIDEEASNLDGGVYDAEAKTITWNIEVEEINTFENGTDEAKIINVEKKIELLYKDIEVLQDSMINEIDVALYLPTNNKTIPDETEEETPIDVKGKIIVKYVDKYTEEEISEQVEKEDKVGKEFDVSGDVKEIEGYTLIEEPKMKTGLYKEEEQEIVYYYAKNTDMHVTYVDKETGEEISEEEIILGYEGKEYETEEKLIEGYTFVESTDNTEGTMTRERIEVVYYYLYNTKVIVQYIDRYTDEVLDTVTEEGLVGDEYESYAKYFENYVLDEEPEEKTVTMTRETIILKYYYIHISAGVIERHIDDITGELLDDEHYEGKQGDKYSTKEKNFYGYELVEEKYPTNAEGTMTVEVIEVEYYYKKKAKVIAEYIDKITNEKITEDVIINGYEKDPYTTEAKEFEEYKLVEIPENSQGEMTVTKNEEGTLENEIVVKYYYIHESAGVIEKHIDIKSEKVLAEERYEGYEGDPYETTEKDFIGYKLVEERYPENAKGKMAKEEIVVTYYYKKEVEVVVEYVDKYTGEKIIPDEIIKGYEGDEYSAEQKEITGYDFIEVIGKPEGIMKPDGENKVTYYYLKPATVIVKYVDEEKNEEIAEQEKKEGHQGDEYVTSAKEIEYYKITKLPENATGTMEGEIEVIYYYRKARFDLSIDKTISSLSVDGSSKRITDENMVKAEVYRKDVNSTNIKIEYNIELKNEGEIAGKAVILEKIPEYLKMNKSENKVWTIEGDEARYETEEIAPGETKNYKVVMTWVKGSGNFGTLRNLAKIEKTENVPGYEETNLENNADEADVIVTVSTGVEKVSGIIIVGIIYLLAAVYVNKRLDYIKVKVQNDK